MKGKKGQLGNIQGVVITLIVVVSLLAVGFFVLQEFMTQDQFYESQTEINETDAYINETGYTVKKSSGEQTKDFTLTAIWEEDSGEYNKTVALTQASITSHSGIVTNATATTYTNVSLSYTYNEGGGGWSGINSTMEAFTTIPTLLGLIILVAMIGIVLAIVFNVMPGARVAGA